MKQLMKHRMMKTAALVILGVAMAGGSAVAADKWDGGDDLPTSPLACDAGPAAAAAAKPYDGGQTTGAPDKAGKPITLVDVPKLIGIGYFNATSKGMQDAAKEIGNVKVTTDGPTEAKIDEQIKFIDNYITRGVDGILFAANDPVAIAPVLKKALVEGDSRGRLRRQLAARCAPVVRQSGPVQRHRQSDGRRDGQGSRRGQGFAIVTSDVHHAQSGALDRRNVGLRRQMPSQAEMAGNGGGAGGQRAVVQPGHHADQQIWRQAFRPVRHDIGRHARLGRSRHQGWSVRQARRRRPRHAECDEALRQCRLRQVRSCCGTRSISAMPRPM